MRAKTVSGRRRAGAGLFTGIVGVAGLLAAAPSTSAAGATDGALVNPSFESPQTGGYVAAPANAGWVFTGSGGVQHNGSAYSGSTVAPDGNQTAFLQGNSGTVGTMSQSVTLTGGTYSISFRAARRWSTVQPVRVSVDGTAIGTYTPADNTFSRVTTATFTATAGPHTIQLGATDSSADRTTFVDVVAINKVGATTGPGAPGQPPAAPTGLTAIGGDTRAVLNWTATPDATGYSVYRGTSAGNESTTPIVTGLTTTSYTNTALTNGTTYYFTVKATGTTGTSPASNEAIATPLKTPTGDIDLTGYRPTFAEEFDAMSVRASSPKGSSTWYGLPPYGSAGNFSSSNWTTDALSTSGGVLYDRAYQSGGKWYSGYLSSTDATGAGFSQLYGYFEARVKMPNSGLGSWPAFWLASTNGIPAVSPTKVPNEEVDVFEWYGGTNQPGNAQPLVQQASHNYPTTGSQNPAGSSYLYSPTTRMPGGDNPWEGYHTYGVQIDAVHITWYIDGVQTNQIATPTQYLTSPFYMMVDYGLGGGWPLTGVVNGSQLQVDWVRAYALRGQ